MGRGEPAARSPAHVAGRRMERQHLPSRAARAVLLGAPLRPVLQILPVYHLTGNLILCYNLLFLSAFVLSGLGMYLLVRRVHEAIAARHLSPDFSSRLCRYRVAQIRAHPVAELAVDAARALRVPPLHHHGRPHALIGGAVALLMQNRSSGYFLMYFTPVIVVFVLHQVITSDRSGDWRLWAAFAMAALLVAVGTAPVLALYWQGRSVYGLERPFEEIANFSGDVYSYFTAAEGLRFAKSTPTPSLSPKENCFSAQSQCRSPPRPSSPRCAARAGWPWTWYDLVQGCRST